MLPTQCSFCQHENTPGARFCADCGSPMHLKVCPNPECGKVSDVGAAVCETCGQTFPALTLASPETKDVAAPAGTQEPGSDSLATEKPAQRTAAWPLIMMAIVAGGIPLLWANRAQLPTPRTWQVDTPDASRTGGAPAAIPPIPPSTAPTPPPPAPVNSALTPVHPSSPGAVDSGATSEQQQPATAAAPKKIVKAPRPQKTESARPCTEATAALGLCDPKQAEK